MRSTAALMAFFCLTLLGCETDTRFMMPDGSSPGGLGGSCSEASECSSNLCVSVGPTEGRCSQTCGADFECPTSWSCTDQGGTQACSCVASIETCNGVDDDCDLGVDEGTGADVGCGSGEVCSAGTCGCPPERLCGGACLDIDTDANNCGACGNVCSSGVCAGGSCCTLVDADASVDLLFVIDNSGSMSEEQGSFAAALPRFFQDLAAGTETEAGITDVQVGVITVDMGVGGVMVPTCTSSFGDDGVLRTEGRTDISGCQASYPSFLGFAGASVPPSFAGDVGCVATAGTGGCGFEQQLEAMLKAVTPGSAATRFTRGSTGHADGANNGFLREGATLAVVLLTDEEDCSASNDDIYNPASEAFSTDLNLRCFAHPEALHPISRYVDGLIAAKGDASRVVFAPIAGIPVDLAPAPGAATDFATLIGPERDSRMVERVDPGMPRLIPSCNVPGRGLAFAPVRIVQLASQLQDRGVRTTVQSICEESMASPLEAVRRAIAGPRTRCE